MADALTDILDRHIGRDGALLTILHDVQAKTGFISEEVMAVDQVYARPTPGKLSDLVARS